MQNFDDLDIEGRNPSHLLEEECEKEEYDRKRLMRCRITAEDGTLRPMYSLTDEDDVWCHICNISLFGKHKLLSHNYSNRHKMKLDDRPYSVSLWFKHTDPSKSGKQNNATLAESALPVSESLAPGEPVPPGMEDQLTRSTTIQVSLDRHRTSPLVGLEYILELVDDESCEPSYTCVLCDKRGDPRTVMSHIASYNHRITYLNRHFPTVSRAIIELPRTPNYKRGANEISVLVAKKIEEVFGRLQPQLVDKYQFEKNKMQHIKRVYQDYHFRERPGRTFMEVYDVRWVTNFDEMMAEVSGTGKKEDTRQKQQHLYQPSDTTADGVEAEETSKKADKDRFSKKNEAKDKDKSSKKEDGQPRYNKLQHFYQHDDNPAASIEAEESAKKEDKKADKERFSKKTETKDKEKPIWKIRILTKEKLNTRGGDKSEEKSKPSGPVRPSDDTKSLSSLSSISSSPSPSRSRSRSRSRKQHGGARSSTAAGSANRHKRRSAGGRRSRSIEPWRERDKWDKYRRVISRAEETLQRALKFHEKNPEKHPAYPDEWKKFWNRRYKELQADGKDPSKHDFKPEWIEFWNKRMRELHTEQLQQRKEDIRKHLELPEERVSKKTERSDKSKKPDKDEQPDKSERSERWSVGRGSSRDRHEASPTSVKRSRHHVESEDDDVEYVGTTKTVKTTEYVERNEPPRERDYGYTYTRGRAGIYRTSTYYPPSRSMNPRTRHYPTSYLKDQSQSPPAKEELLREDLEIVGLLRLLTALEGQLGSLGPKIVTLLSRALAAEKAQPNSAEDLLNDEEVCVLFETVKEKLKGQLFAGMIEKVAVTPTKSAIQNIAKLLHKASETKRKLEQLLKQQLQDEEERRKRCEIELTRPLLASFAATSSIYRRAGDASKLRSEPVSVPGVGAVDKVAIAQQIAAALIAQGRTNVSQAELETLINAVVGMAEASQHSDKPITAASFVKGLTAASRAGASSSSLPVKLSETSSSTAATIALAAVARASSPDATITPRSRDEQESSTSQRREASPNDRRESSSLQRETSIQREAKDRSKSTRMESLSDNDLKTLLQNFKDLGTDEQHGLINFLKKLEATDIARVEKLRGYVNLGTPASASSSAATNRAEPTETTEATTRGGSKRSMSPFSTRKSNQNPTDDDSKWKPKLDMFADAEAEPKRQKQEPSQQHQQSQENTKRTKARVDLSNDEDDDDDYSFEDIYKAADKNVSESERARGKRSSRSRSNSSRSWSRSRSRTPSRSRISPVGKPRDIDSNKDPNAILNETKRLIANIMGDLPNKYVVKSHPIVKSAKTEVAPSRPAIPQLPVPQQNLYGSNYPTTDNNSMQQAMAPSSSMAYQQMGNHQFANYQQQQNAFNPNAGGYNGYNYNQSYGGNMGPMGNNQGQQPYGAAAMQSNQYGGQQQQQSTQQQQQMYGMSSQYGGPNNGPPVGYPQQQYGNYQQQRFY